MHGSLPQKPQYSLKPQNPAIKSNHRNQHGTQWQNSGMEPCVAYPEESHFCGFHFSFLNKVFLSAIWGFPSGSEGKASAWNAGGLGSIPGPGRSPGEGNGNPLQYSCLENPMERGDWQATVHGVPKSWKRLSDLTSLTTYQLYPNTKCFWCLKKYKN